MKKLILTTLLAFGISGPAHAALPFQSDSIGPITDVTANWQAYQPANAFCIRPDAPQYTPGGNGATATGADPVCLRSGFAAGETGLYKVQIDTPPLCSGCRRLFIDFSKATAANGHAYYHLTSADLTITVDPLAHSPNTKNFTNDKLVTPDGSLQEPIIAIFDLHAIAYVADTAYFVHNAIQGPYYIGPWYLNSRGQRINGVYLDVSAASGDAISYVDGFNSGRLCPSDADLFYGGCVDDWSFSATSA